jgi:hypothetical protein
MTPFEYVVVLISIILGLGITTILTGVADWIKHYRRSTLYPPYIIWIVLVFVMHVHEWWESYSLKSIEAWQLPLFLFVILYPINLYVLAHLLFPRQTDEPFNAKEFYLNRYPTFFTCVLILDLLSVIHNVTISRLPVTGQFVHLLLFLILGGVLLSKTKKDSIHLAVSILLLAILVATLVFTQDTLLIRSDGATDR